MINSILVSTYSRGNKDGSFASTEGPQRFLSLLLGAVAMDTGAGVALSVQEMVKGVRSLLGLHKHKSQGVWAC